MAGRNAGEDARWSSRQLHAYPAGASWEGHYALLREDSVKARRAALSSVNSSPDKLPAIPLVSAFLGRHIVSLCRPDVLPTCRSSCVMHNWLHCGQANDARISNPFQTSHWYTCDEFADGTPVAVSSQLLTCGLAGRRRRRTEIKSGRLIVDRGRPFRALGDLADSSSRALRTWVKQECSSQK